MEGRDLSKSYGEKVVLRHQDLALPQGEITCLMGPSGCGKTTLLRLILGLEAPDSGELLGLSGIRKSAVFQENRLCENISAILNVCLTAPALSREEAAKGLSALGIGEDSQNVAVSTLSGGMKRRVAILRALLAPSDLLVLDEPFQGLDEATKARVIAAFLEQVKGKTVLLVTHDKNEALAVGGNVVELSPPKI